jgi:hypothetical protein
MARLLLKNGGKLILSAEVNAALAKHAGLRGLLGEQKREEDADLNKTTKDIKKLQKEAEKEQEAKLKQKAQEAQKLVADAAQADLLKELDEWDDENAGKAPVWTRARTHTHTEPKACT